MFCCGKVLATNRPFMEMRSSELWKIMNWKINFKKLFMKNLWIQIENLWKILIVWCEFVKEIFGSFVDGVQAT